MEYGSRSKFQKGSIRLGSERYQTRVDLEKMIFSSLHGSTRAVSVFESARLGSARTPFGSTLVRTPVGNCTFKKLKLNLLKFPVDLKCKHNFFSFWNS